MHMIIGARLWTLNAADKSSFGRVENAGRLAKTFENTNIILASIGI